MQSIPNISVYFLAFTPIIGNFVNIYSISLLTSNRNGGILTPFLKTKTFLEEKTMKKYSKLIALMLIAVLALGLAGCAKEEPKADAPVVITVATNPEYPPFEYVEGDKIVGYDIELWDAIAKKAGIEYKIEAMDFDAVISAVATNKNTVGLSGISITDERKLTVDFSEGYINAGLVVIVRADKPFATKEELAGKKIGVQLGTTSDFTAEEITGKDNVSQYKTFLNAIMELQGNNLDAVIIDKPVGQAILASLKDDNLVMVDMGLQADWYGIEVNKQNPELLKKINAALAELEKEGFMDQLAVKYFN